MIRALCTFICALALLSVVLPARAEPLSLASHYAASGSNPDGSKYTGSVDVKVISDTTYTVVWKIGDETYQGFGMRLNDSLAATYTIDGEPGLIIYKVDGDGLTGAWAIRGHRAPSSAELVVNGARGDLRTDCRRDITEIFTPLLNGRLS